MITIGSPSKCPRSVSNGGPRTRESAAFPARQLPRRTLAGVGGWTSDASLKIGATSVIRVFSWALKSRPKSENGHREKDSALGMERNGLGLDVAAVPVRVC